MQYKVALIEDNNKDGEKFISLMKDYSASSGSEFEVVWFKDAFDFFDEPIGKFNAVFLDIELPLMDGMEAARRIREKDEDVVIEFVTNMAQYAINGYDVNAYDFVLKPLTRESLFVKMDRLCNKLMQMLDDYSLELSGRGWSKRVKALEIYYVEVQNHNLIFHLKDEKFAMRATLSEFEGKLRGHHFSLCNACYLVNLRHISEIKGSSVYIGKEELIISRHKKKSFMDDLARYIGGSE